MRAADFLSLDGVKSLASSAAAKLSISLELVVLSLFDFLLQLPEVFLRFFLLDTMPLDLRRFHLCQEVLMRISSTLEPSRVELVHHSLLDLRGVRGDPTEPHLLGVVRVRECDLVGRYALLASRCGSGGFRRHKHSLVLNRRLMQRHMAVQR